MKSLIFCCICILFFSCKESKLPREAKWKLLRQADSIRITYTILTERFDKEPGTMEEKQGYWNSEIRLLMQREDSILRQVVALDTMGAEELKKLESLLR